MQNRKAVIYTLKRDYRSPNLWLKMLIALFIARYYALSQSMMDYYEQNEKEIIGTVIVGALLWCAVIVRGYCFY